MAKLLAGKLALVTGAGSGIGRAVCRVLAREGAKVVATDRNVKDNQETVDTLDGTGHVALSMEVSKQESVETTFNDVIKQFSKPPTIIVNSAAIGLQNFLISVNSKEFDDVININMKGTVFVMQTAVKAMIEADATKDSSIINISSIYAKQTVPICNIYNASKAGVLAITSSACMEFGKLGIRVNAVLPGYVKTPMTTFMSDTDIETFLMQVALKRPGNPEEIAEVITFLASDRSSYVNGAFIYVHGGMLVN